MSERFNPYDESLPYHVRPFAALDDGDNCSYLDGPDGFECALGEPEDRIWGRDGAEAVEELNKLYARALAAESRLATVKHVLRLITEGLEAFHAELIASEDSEDWTHASTVDSILYLVGKGPTAETLKAGDPNWTPTIRAALAAPDKEGACSRFQPWGCAQDELGKPVDPRSCFVCGASEKAHVKEVP